MTQQPLRALLPRLPDEAFQSVADLRRCLAQVEAMRPDCRRALHEYIPRMVSESHWRIERPDWSASVATRVPGKVSEALLRKVRQLVEAACRAWDAELLDACLRHRRITHVGVLRQCVAYLREIRERAIDAGPARQCFWLPVIEAPALPVDARPSAPDHQVRRRLVGWTLLYGEPLLEAAWPLLCGDWSGRNAADWLSYVEKLEMVPLERHDSVEGVLAAIVANVWDCMRSTPGKGRPPEPARPKSGWDVYWCDRALDIAVRWCDQEEARARRQAHHRLAVRSPVVEGPPPDAPGDPAVASAAADAALLSASDLARRLGEPPAAVESFLRRYRDRYPDCYVEADAPRRNEARYLYRTADVLPALRQRQERRARRSG